MTAPLKLFEPLPAALAPTLALLERWAEAGALRAVDVALADFVARGGPADRPATPALMVATALVSRQVGLGHTALELTPLAHDPAATLAWPAEAAVPEPELRAELRRRKVGDWPALLADEAGRVGRGPGSTPLVLDDERLYLRRQWQQERAVRRMVTERLAPDADAPTPEQLRPAIAALFQRPGTPPPAHLDWQRAACALAPRQKLMILTGGPGTGKTFTVVKLLALLQWLQAQAGREPLRIELAAPTGKAAARLGEAIAGSVDGLDLDALAGGAEAAAALRATIPKRVVTLHRLLGARPGTRRLARHADHPLALDLLVIDEASMLDLEMAAAVAAALPAQARLVLIGDKDQLASVEAGAVLGTLCEHAAQGGYDAATVAWLEAAVGAAVDPLLCAPAQGPVRALDQAVVMLRQQHRFSADSGIARLAQAVNAGDAAAVTALWKASPADLQRVEPDDAEGLRRLVLEGRPAQGPVQGVLAFDGDAAAGSEGTGAPAGLRRLFAVVRDQRPPIDADAAAFDAWALSALQAQGDFQVLAALREGPQGVAGLNERIAGWLRGAGLLAGGAIDHAVGRPVMVTRNEHDLGLMNGDLGLTLQRPECEGDRLVWRVRLAFRDGKGGVRWVSPSRLAALESAFALTVHKAQGSEFGHAVLVLPEAGGQGVTRELVYTAITRARAWFTVVGAREVLVGAVKERVRRAGGPLAGAPD